MDSREIRSAFLDFFESKGHTIVESSSLVPDNDPTLLFTNAGMVQFKDAFAFRENRGYTRAASVQRCVRAGGKHNDLDNVGYTARHHTFFEMLGNFSFGDYFKEEAIRYAWEFLTEVVGLPADKLWVTVHDSDDEAERIWIEKVGFDPDRITRLGDDDNFWTMGDTGPCGPSSEIFYDHGPDVPGGPPGSEEGDLDRFIEIWNLVFTQYDRSADGTLTPLPKPCVDTGMGLERLAAVVQHVNDNYDIDLFQALIKKAASLLGATDLGNPSLKVVADHIRTAVFLIADGVVPSNEGRGYVLRRIIRRALRHGHKLQSSGPFFNQLVAEVVDQMGEAYPLIQQTQAQVQRILLKEETQFDLTLDQGMRILGDAIQELDGTEIPGQVVFKLYDTYGFPTDLTADIARERNLTLDLDGFDREMEAQRERARASSQFGVADTGDLDLDFVTEFVGYDSLEDESAVVALIKDGETVDAAESGDQVLVVLDRTPFYAESGGQVGDTGEMSANGARLEILDTKKSGDAFVHQANVVEGIISNGAKVATKVDRLIREATRLNHSATHLMHAALRQVLGEHVNQRGSLVNADRLRFDFSHFEAVTKEQIREIERVVNDQVMRNSAIETEVMDLEAAKEKGAMALFGEKYSEKVRVLTMGEGFSVELCGGTHAGRTGDIGLFRITSEQGVAAGVRRIEAVTGSGALSLVEEQEDLIQESAGLIKADASSLLDKLQSLVEQNKKLEKTVADLNRKLATGGGQDVAEAAIDLGGFKLLVTQLDGADPKSLPDALDQLKNKIGTGIVILGTVNDGKVGLIAGVTKDLTDRFNAGELVNHVASQVGGKGGGRPDMARAGGSEPDALPGALESVEAFVRDKM
ncbi:MAG: alanine--tRNA ligase [Pseudomonadales bacterium]|nr:alanine--tRNA ligase [Pseudomonadales bacterium]MBO6596184.1 alanine--tRNA ligase [Pseudomonadales bacterium]MBO6822664.1 alanine--tRNA ligase [Pseudomonadales bacterium]